MTEVVLVPFLEMPIEIQMESRNWRNRQDVAKYFKIQHIDIETHKKWLRGLCATAPRTIAFFIQYNQDLVGVTYFHSLNYTDKIADWGMYIYRPECRGRGIGHIVLQQCIDYARNVLKLRCLYLDVLQSNSRARSVYEDLGFVLTGASDGDFLRYKKDL